MKRQTWPGQHSVTAHLDSVRAEGPRLPSPPKLPQVPSLPKLSSLPKVPSLPKGPALLPGRSDRVVAHNSLQLMKKAGMPKHLAINEALRVSGFAPVFLPNGDRIPMTSSSGVRPPKPPVV